MSGSTNASRCALTCALALGCTAGARATDGITEINAARAAAGGVTPADTPGYPVTIDRSGSYVLTSNLDLRASVAPGESTADTTAIEITGIATRIHLDLNGFAILGSVDCSDLSSGSCNDTGGLGSGVFAPSRGSRIENGTIEGMGHAGVTCGETCVVEGINAASNHQFGIAVGIASRVTDCTVSRNGNDGIRARTSVVSGNTSYANGGDGIHVEYASLVIGNVVFANVQFGLRSFTDGSQDGAFYGGGEASAANYCGTDTTCP